MTPEKSRSIVVVDEGSVTNPHLYFRSPARESRFKRRMYIEPIHFQGGYRLPLLAG